MFSNSDKRVDPWAGFLVACMLAFSFGCGSTQTGKQHGVYLAKLGQPHVDSLPTLGPHNSLFKGKPLGDVCQAMKLDFEELEYIVGPTGRLAGLSYTRLEGTNREEVVVWLDNSKPLSSLPQGWTYDRLKKIPVFGTSTRRLGKPDFSTPEETISYVVRSLQRMDPNSLWLALSIQLRQSLMAQKDGSEELAVAMLRGWSRMNKLPKPQEWKITSVHKASMKSCTVTVEFVDDRGGPLALTKRYPLVKEGNAWKLFSLECP